MNDRTSQPRSRKFQAASLMGVTLALDLGAAPAVACGGLVGENGTIQLVRTTTLAAYRDGDRALRHVVRVHRRGRGGRLDRAAARRADRGRARRRLDAAAPGPGGGAAASVELAAAGRSAAAAERRRGAARDEDRRPRHHRPAGRGRRGRRWAADHGFLLTPDAPGGARLLRRRSQVFMAARFDAERAAELGQGAGDGTPIMADDPDRRAVGAAAHPRPRARRRSPRRGRRVPAHRRRARAAGRRHRA